MKITQIILENFKGFKGVHEFNLDKDLTFIVGDNNTGKSTLFEAISFLQNGGKTAKDVRHKSVADDANVGVTVILKGDIKTAIEDFSQPKFLNNIYEEDGVETLKIRRQSEPSKWKDSRGQEKELSIKDIGIWNEAANEFQNPSGFSTAFKTLFESQFIWANTNPDDVSDFGATKICGKLLGLAASGFFASPTWTDFKATHRKTFLDGEDSLKNKIKDLEQDIKTLLTEQYGETDVSFTFDIPDEASFIKMGDIELDDGVPTSKKDKGNGMQRALALVLIQLYSKHITKHPEKDVSKPLFFFVDEPETFLHPKAQQALLSALDNVAKLNQVFITTHSPYMLKKFDKDRHSLLMFAKDAAGNGHEDISSKLATFGASSPTWGEINYYAYGLTTAEFHNELYGFIQARETINNAQCYHEDPFEQYLISSGIPQNVSYTRQKKDMTTELQTRTLPTYVRNIIHHPENSHNTYTADQLRISIEELLKIA